MKLEIDVHCVNTNSIRVQQLAAMFEVPVEDKLAIHLRGELPLEERQWSVGLIVGPSGSGKTLTLHSLFGEPEQIEWTGEAVIDNFPQWLTIDTIVESLKAVGFNTIPAWMRPFSVLSNGEQFRVNIARHLLSQREVITIDEFTSVVDRQVAKIASHAVQQRIRAVNNQKLVVASCHYDIVDWLQPDWIYEPASTSFTWRSLRPRPTLDVEIARVDYEAWKIFAPFHYMSQDLHRAAQCFGAWVDGRLATFCGVLYRPHPTAQNIVGVSRVVTLPDWQGLGLGMLITKQLAAAYCATGFIFHQYPNHPVMIRSYQRQLLDWQCVKQPGSFSTRRSNKSTLAANCDIGGKRCAVFRYVGPPMPAEQAHALLGK